MTSEAEKRANKKYDQTEKGKARNARYNQTEKGKIVGAHAIARYNQTDKGKIRDVHYNQTDKGKIVDARVKARRKRGLDFKPMNSWFSGCNGHHINKKNVLFIPEELHRSIRHSQDDPVSMQKINNIAFEWLCTQEII